MPSQEKMFYHTLVPKLIKRNFTTKASLTSFKGAKQVPKSIIMPITPQRLFMANKEHVNIQYEDFIRKVFSLVLASPGGDRLCANFLRSLAHLTRIVAVW